MSLALLEGKKLPTRQQPYNQIGDDELNAAVRVLKSRNLSGFIGRACDAFLGGVEVLRLEKAFSERFQVKHAVSFNSASTALQAAVTALGIGPGDEVITSPYTMSATATAILANCAIPVFADIDTETFCLDPESVRRVITPKTKAMIVVNIFGGPAKYDELLAIAKEHGLKIIEDNAQAPGATYKGKLTSTIGDIGIFSLNVHKVIQCGEGSILVTNDDELAYRAQLVRNHGEVVVDDLNDASPEHALIGNNFRLSEVHAAIAAEQLKKLDVYNDARIEAVAYLVEGLKKFSWVTPFVPMDDVRHVYYMYPFRFDTKKLGISRKTFAEAMSAEGFPLGVGYVKPLYLQPLYQQKRMFPRSQFPFVSSEFPTTVSYEKGICPVTERLFEKELLTTTVFLAPNDRATMDAFLDAMKRIEENVEALRAYEAA
jgi:dTDP-4-amino-4,6-dideoxygalactose transaminase